MSKITVAGVRTNVQQLLDYSNNTKKRNFLETVELQIGLKNYDPQRRFRITFEVWNRHTHTFLQVTSVFPGPLSFLVCLVLAWPSGILFVETYSISC